MDKKLILELNNHNVYLNNNYSDTKAGKFYNLDKLSYLNKIKISFGIHEEIGDKVEKVKIFNLDGTTTESEMTLSDIMFFIEHGTVTRI